MALGKLVLTVVALSAISGGAGSVYYYNLSKTIKDELTRENFQIIAGNAIDKIWKTAWNEINSDLVLKAVETSINSFETLKSWCTNSYNEWLDEKLEKVKKICIQPPKNIGEKLAKKGKSFTSDWGKKLTSLKNGDNGALLKKLKETTPNLQDLNTTEASNTALKTWCESKKTVEISETSGVADYEEVVKNCVE